jgi:serine/threonine protein kinase
VSTANERDGRVEAFLARAGAAGAGDEAAPLWREGREAGEWTVAGFVGRGGSAEVYCARHRRLGTEAVLKVLWRDGEGPRERFDRETRFLMEGPGRAFPAFYGAGVEEGRPWMAMELLEEYPLPKCDADVAAYLLDVARGVEELHRRGWVHRDLKPRNILRRASDGHAVLIDFGLLKRAGEDAAAETAAGRESPSVVDGREVGVGTPGYAAPEQFAGGAATPASDVHALGMLADECFGGKPPRAWERIIRRATGSLPRQRYADAAAMARAIRRRFWPRNAAWAVLAAAVLAAAAVWRGAGEEKAEIPEGPEVPEEVAVQAAVPRKSVREERAAALARFEADEGRKEAILGLVDGMQRMGLAWVGRHEVTQGQWEALMDENPSRFRGEDLPVDSLPVGACLEFIERLNATSIAKQEKLRFRLPSASEWKLLVREPPATAEGRLSAGWFAENSGGRTHPGGEKQGGAYWGDALGNVRELTRSWGEADGKEGFRCMGGSWADPAEGEGIPEAVLEQPRFMGYWDALASADTVPSDYPNAVCPVPGEIGFRLWADDRTPPREEPFAGWEGSDGGKRDDGGWEWR